VANVDPNYREWQSRAARKIVEQFHDGTLEVVAKRGAELSDGRMTVDECMARQIVGILLAHQVNEPASKEPEQQTLMGRKLVEVDSDLSKLADITFRRPTQQDALNVLRPQAQRSADVLDEIDWDEIANNMGGLEDFILRSALKSPQWREVIRKLVEVLKKTF
jgi:hypothetical protein